MSTLNLAIDSHLILIQAGIFLGTVYAVKKTMLEPFLLLKRKREALTVGDKDWARRANKDSADKIQKIDGHIRQAIADAKTFRETRRQQALLEQADVVNSGKLEAQKILTTMRSGLAQALQQERQKIQSLVDKAADEVLQAIVH